MNAAQISSARQHHQDRLRLGIGGVVLEVENHAQFDVVELLRPMALFASAAGGHQAFASHGRLNRVADTLKNGVHQLAGPGLLAFHPPGRTRGNVVIHTQAARVRRVLMGGEFRFHHMTGLPAELGRLHMLDRSVCALRSNDDVSC